MFKALESLFSLPPADPAHLYSQARMLREPIGIQGFDKKDLSKARQYFALAAKAGHPKSTYMLGVMLSAGEGGPVDKEQGLQLVNHAAKLGCDDAQFQLGVWEEQVGKTAAALDWYDLAAATHPLAQRRRDFLRSSLLKASEGKFCIGHENYSFAPSHYAETLVTAAYAVSRRAVHDCMMDLDCVAEWNRHVPGWSKVAVDQVAPVYVAACTAYINAVLHPSEGAMDAYWVGLDQGFTKALPEGLAGRILGRIHEISETIESQNQEHVNTCFHATIDVVYEGLGELGGVRIQMPNETERQRLAEMLSYVKTMAILNLEQMPLTWRPG